MSSWIKMKSHDTKDTKIPINDNSEKMTPNVIECSVNMNVSLSNSNKRSKIFQRTQSLLIVVLAIVFAVVCSHLKREVRALEMQMNSANSNLMILMLRYEKLNKNFNRIWYHRSDNQFRPEVKAMDSAIKYSGNISKNRRSLLSEEFKNSGNELIGKIATRVTKGSFRRIATNVETNLNKNSKIDTSMIEEDMLMNDRVERRNGNNADRKRYERAVVAFERRNHETVTTAIPGISDDFNDDTSPWNESRAGRSRRDDGRGKKRRKIKRRLKRSRRHSGPLVATFVGAVPEQHVTDAVYVGPWVKSTRNESRYAFNKFHLVEDKKSIEVTANGLYMISAQIYYFGEPTHYSYWILLSSEGTSNTRKVIKCATVSAIHATEASCYTSVVLPLRRGDRIHVQQQERDRLINLREGHSYVQIMLLSSESTRRRVS